MMLLFTHCFILLIKCKCFFNLLPVDKHKETLSEFCQVTLRVAELLLTEFEDIFYLEV